MRSLTLFTTTLAIVLGMSFAAQATTLTMTSDKTSYAVGEAITITVTGDVQGTDGYKVDGQILASGSGGVDFSGAIYAQEILGAQTFNGSVPFTDGGVGGYDGEVMAQAGGLSPVIVDSTDQIMTATMVITAATAGVVNFGWQTTGVNYLKFFGLTNAAGIAIQIIPEPTTAGLMGLGLLGLAISGRRVKN